MKLKTKRIYEEPGPFDGFRVLVDRLWPRGVSKQKAKIDLWIKEIAPSNELRKWYGHNPKKWNEFRKKYKAELRKTKVELAELKRIISSKKNATLLYAAKDEKFNNAVVLKEALGF